MWGVDWVVMVMPPPFEAVARYSAPVVSQWTASPSVSESGRSHGRLAHHGAGRTEASARTHLCSRSGEPEITVDRVQFGRLFGGPLPAPVKLEPAALLVLDFAVVQSPPGRERGWTFRHLGNGTLEIFELPLPRM
jgi:hypothetical protein